MKTLHRTISALVAFVIAMTMSAQTDLTSRITNPSFETGTVGWEVVGMKSQNNSVFSIKGGSIYMERWTGRGSAVGSGRLAQELQSLPPGNYELTVAAQNIQEDTPTTAQTGAWIFAGDKKTTVAVRDNYTVAFNYISGIITIGFEAKNASGNWLAVDNFRLKRVGDDLSAELAAAIEQTAAAYGNVSGEKSQQLKDAIETARGVAANSSATGEQQAAAIVGMEQAVDIYLRANASASNPLAMTDLITNPSFETGDLTGWNCTGMGTMDNSFFTIKQGTWYVERWTWKGNAAGDARLSQTLTNMPAGRYRLKAAAQNIQEDTPKKAQTGAWIFAGDNTKTVTVRNTYTLEFVQVADVMEIGFEAKGATGNWLSVDNFQLEYIGDSSDDVTTEFTNLIAKAETLAEKRMNASAKTALDAAIADARVALGASDLQQMAQTATTLEAAIATATASQAVFARLAEAIDAANEEIATASQTTDYQTAINDAQAVYDAASATDAQAEAAITALAEASFAFKILNAEGSGNVPTVVTDTRFVRGATWAFGRSTVSGSNIMEEGFCWSEQPDPKVTDSRTTEYLDQKGKIYWLRDLKPATIYYMRAYAITKDYAVGYGDVIKFVTVPKGTIGHWYNNGGDEASNERINSAINTAIDYYWNNLTSIHDFGISVTFGSGTQTADCSYGGSMRVGPNASYQQVGTIMHEAFHGIGVGTHGMWWNGDMRSDGNRGVWLGDRVTETVRFWDNDATAVITGDDTHLWPYGCNGSHEDTHTDNQYCMMGILAQALNEDGLPGSGEIGYALPYYAYNHENGVKYYLKNEDENRGLYSAYLVETADHQLQWKAMSADEALANDAAAWYLTFTPSNQYYQLRNAATGYYITYASNTFKTAKHTTPTSADNLHLMRGRLDVGGRRGYYIIHPESSANPPALNAADNGKTAMASWSILRSAKSQRWLVMTADDIQDFETNGTLIEKAKQSATEALAWLKALTKVPHQEEARGADDTVQGVIGELETALGGSMTVSQTMAMTETVRTAGLAFLKDVIPTDEKQPFDLTWLLANPTVDDNIDGWTTTEVITGQSYGCVEYYEKTFDFNQTVTGLPYGKYDFQAQAFQRPGPYGSAANVAVNALLYAGSKTQKLAHITDGAQSSKLGTGREVTINNKYVPDNMEAANAYFDRKLYSNSVNATVTTTGGSLKVGVKCASKNTGYWVIFDNFHLYYSGYMTPGDVNRDGKVDGSDVDTVIDHLLGNTPDVFSRKAADLNEDGYIDILDVTTLIKKIVNK